MERRGDGQQHAALDAVVLYHRDRALDRGGVARKDDLARRVVVGDRADLALGGSSGERRRLIDLGTQQCAHRAFAHRHGSLH